MEHLDPELLLTWAKVARAGNLKAVSQQLFISQPALSHQMRKLQDWFEEPLYQRTTHGIEPTVIGRRLQRIGEQIEALIQEARLLRQHTHDLILGNLKILASQTNAEFILPRLISAFHEAYPAVNVELTTVNSREAWANRAEADLVFLENSQNVLKPPAEWQQDHLIETEIVLIARPDHPLAQQDVVALDVLREETIVWREEGSGIREHALNALHQQGIFPEVHYALSGLSAVRDAVRYGLGVAFASALVSPHQQQDLAVIRLCPAIPHTLSMVYRTPGSTALEAFVHKTHELLMGYKSA
ncbi:MAG: LysR family transcriptional regulator [Acidithiobacillus caldus]|jgi:DNA-binding transcriptional LysR family regulator|uniref:LysR family transcriptional regulator YeiE n=6 Tax=Acidithiobacillus caldus TaxID=33059 RepID=A0A059ZZ33_ACICK|nr:LysR family transcriptional regulator [Acidithiobacillus caldus]AIA55241.1 LysR family transcriptional regulator YeiE [Acidithiobacillus caldus ATCC 51756]MBU2736474.1 LysR family transcriptional regulator [Acidithiobacillus caldus ATCC 51756]MBU2791280.1 LysR family transcriptional regulator [Acidithiobacillus caldus]MBU2820941.1 LysR family transcriptional regulator [Acidithiobacillus caldus]OFC60733.1 LysR family transcriptional regulator [Acidithiobacillus caldus]